MPPEGPAHLGPAFALTRGQPLSPPFPTSARSPAAFSSATSRRVGPPHHRLRALQQGTQGRPVVLLHGLASLADEILQPLGEPLVEAGFRVVAIDRSGYGGSDEAVAARMGPAAQAEGLDRTLIQLGLSDAIVVAHSAGAAPALHLARRSRRRIAGLVLVSPFCRPTRPRAALGLRAANAPVIGPVLRRALPEVAGVLGRAMVQATLHQGQAFPDERAFPWRRMAQPSAVQAMAAELRGFNADMIGLRTRLKTVTSPTLVLLDPEDRVIDASAHGRWLTQRLPTCAVRHIAAGHLLHHFEPAAVLDAVLSIDVAAQLRMVRIC